MLQEHWTESRPERRTKGPQFLKAHRRALTLTGFFTTKVWTRIGQQTIYTFFIIHIRARCVHIVGSTPPLDASFTKQTALDIVVFDNGLLRGSTHLLMDRYSNLAGCFREIL